MNRELLIAAYERIRDLSAEEVKLARQDKAKPKTVIHSIEPVETEIIVKSQSSRFYLAHIRALPLLDDNAFEFTYSIGIQGAGFLPLAQYSTHTDEVKTLAKEADDYLRSNSIFVIGTEEYLDHISRLNEYVSDCLVGAIEVISPEDEQLKPLHRDRESNSMWRRITLGQPLFSR